MKQTVLNGGQSLNPGSSITSPNGQFNLVYQTDGNLVLYGPGRQALWHSGTSGRSAGRAIMQPDGNLVVYDTSNRSVWCTGTWGNGGARLALQDDGNLVVYSSGGRALWNTGTYGGRSNLQPPQTLMFGGQSLNPGSSITSPNGQFNLVYQTDGNLVLYGPGRQALWHSGTSGRSAGRAIMQPDGNLVVYDASGRSVWNTGTWGNGGARLALQDDGNLVVYDTGGRALWNAGTWGGRSNIQLPASTPASVLRSQLGRWKSQTYNTTLDVTRYRGGIKVSWNSGGEGWLTQEGSTLWVRHPLKAPHTYVVMANLSDVSPARIIWSYPAPRGGWEDTWTNVDHVDRTLSEWS